MIVLNSNESYENIDAPKIEIDYTAVNNYFNSIYENQRELSLKNYLANFEIYLKRKGIENPIIDKSAIEINSYFYKAFYQKTKKGIGIIGTAGTGKTTFFNYYLSTQYDNFENNHNRLKIVSIRDITNAYLEEQIKGVEALCSPVMNTRITSLYIDDLGKETPIMNSYGQKQDIMTNIIDFRYSMWNDSDFKNKLYFTSNFNLKDLQKRYTEIYYSRLFEMCHIIEKNGKNLRFADV
jgi:DNA replication protein DnaC